MTRRIFDVENEKDMQDLWDILPDDIVRISPMINKEISYLEYKDDEDKTDLFKIEWHKKTEITRPIQEATEYDIGKLCYFWDDNTSNGTYCILIEVQSGIYKSKRKGYYEHARRLTKQEVVELC